MHAVRMWICSNNNHALVNFITLAIGFIVHAVHSFVELVKYVFTIPGVSAFLSNRICQDPIENFFGKQRQRGRACDNPNAKEFIKATQALRVINGTCRTIRGNCRGAQLASSSQKRILLDSETNTPLPKRQYKHK